jgi:hypothetical protein
VAYNRAWAYKFGGGEAVPREPEDMMAAVAEGLEARTGHDLDTWVQIVNSAGLDPLDQLAVRRWLKAEHGVPQNSQWAIADAAARAAGWTRPSVDQYIDRQYAGPKAHLRPTFDRIYDAARSLGPDVTVEGRGTYTPFVRARQFAAVAATKTRVELGLRFVDPPADPRLVATKSLGQSTHKVGLTSPDEVAGIVDLLRRAYDQNG